LDTFGILTPCKTAKLTNRAQLNADLFNAPNVPPTAPPSLT